MLLADSQGRRAVRAAETAAVRCDQLPIGAHSTKNDEAKAVVGWDLLHR